MLVHSSKTINNFFEILKNVGSQLENDQHFFEILKNVGSQLETNQQTVQLKKNVVQNVKA